MTRLQKLFLESRKASGLTQMQMARKFGHASAQFISNIERGLATVPVKSIKPYAKFLKADPKDFLMAYLADHSERIQKETKISL